MKSTAEMKKHGEDTFLNKVNFYFKRLNTVFTNSEGDLVTTILVLEKYSYGYNTSNTFFVATVFKQK
jgi:hypothetical protein